LKHFLWCPVKAKLTNAALSSLSHAKRVPTGGYNGYIKLSAALIVLFQMIYDMKLA